MTPIEPATVEALASNRERVISVRAADKEIGRHPPTGDPHLNHPSHSNGLI